MTAADRQNAASMNVWPAASDDTGSRDHGESFATDIEVDLATKLVRVGLIGELDVMTKPLLADGLASVCNRTAFREGSGGTVHLDLSGLTFMDTAGLTALDAARTALIEQGWRVCLVAPQPHILRLLDVAIVCGWLPPDVECPDAPLWDRTGTHDRRRGVAPS